MRRPARQAVRLCKNRICERLRKEFTAELERACRELFFCLSGVSTRMRRREKGKGVPIYPEQNGAAAKEKCKGDLTKGHTAFIMDM